MRVFISVLLLCIVLVPTLSQAQPTRWEIVRVQKPSGEPSTMLIASAIGLDTAYVGYSFPDFQVNACSGVWQFINADSVAISAADCTEACCNTASENQLILLLANMTNYHFQGDTLILQGDFQWPFIVSSNSLDLAHDTLMGLVTINLVKEL